LEYDQDEGRPSPNPPIEAPKSAVAKVEP